MDLKNSKLKSGFDEIEAMGERIHLPSVVLDKAKIAFKQSVETQNSNRTSNDAIAAACIYLACRIESVPRTLKEICSISKSSKKTIGKYLDSVKNSSMFNSQNPASSPADFIPRFSQSLQFSSYELQVEIGKRAQSIVKKLSERNILLGCSPVTLAATAIFIAAEKSSDPKKMSHVAEASGAGTQTIRLAVQKIRKFQTSLLVI